MEARIVEAVGLAAWRPRAERVPRSRQVESAMAEAVRQCYADGIIDPDRVRDRMMAARAAVKATTPT